MEKRKVATKRVVKVWRCGPLRHDWPKPNQAWCKLKYAISASLATGRVESARACFEGEALLSLLLLSLKGCESVIRRRE
jgi:hypothetical protein